MCTLSQSQVSSISTVNSNYWNSWSPASAGFIGFGSSSPVWALANYPSTAQFAIYLTSYNDPATFVDPDYVQTTTTSSFIFNGVSSDYTTAMPYTTFQAHYIQYTESVNEFSNTYFYSSLDKFEFFGFGLTNATTNATTGTTTYTQYYNEFTLSSSYVTQMTMSFRGLGLPKQEFSELSNLLSVITSGQISCLSISSGYCMLPKPCASYAEQGFWNYDFKLKFTSTANSNYIRVPLSTFASTFTY